MVEICESPRLNSPETVSKVEWDLKLDDSHIRNLLALILCCLCMRPCKYFLIYNLISDTPSDSSFVDCIEIFARCYIRSYHSNHALTTPLLSLANHTSLINYFFSSLWKWLYSSKTYWWIVISEFLKLFEYVCGIKVTCRSLKHF